MDEPAWNIIYQDDEIKFGQADGEYALFYDGNTYRLSPIRYEPGINIEGPESIITVHNSFTMEELVSAIENN